MQQEEKRLSELEKTVIKHDGDLKILDNRVTNLENISLRLENTILREGQDTRKILTQVLNHSQNMEKAKLNVWIKLLSAGGLLYVVVITLANQMGG